MNVKSGDIVSRRSYGHDIYFKVKEIESEEAILKGIDVRLLADAPLSDLHKPSITKVEKYNQKSREKFKRCIKNIYSRRSLEIEKIRSISGQEEKDFFEIPGKVLQIDGDKEYLEECLSLFASLGIKASGEYCPEKKQAQVVKKLLKKYRPDMLILTGHDSYFKKKSFQSLDSYRNSKHFVAAVKNARSYQSSKDELVIFAGACQSHYEAIIEAGANYASSPQRVLIHCMDPVFIMEKICFSSISSTVNIFEAISNAITGTEGLGGIETRGKFRLGMPKSPY